jgi:hypothetical protein
MQISELQGIGLFVCLAKYMGVYLGVCLSCCLFASIEECFDVPGIVGRPTGFDVPCFRYIF